MLLLSKPSSKLISFCKCHYDDRVQNKLFGLHFRCANILNFVISIFNIMSTLLFLKYLETKMRYAKHSFSIFAPLSFVFHWTFSSIIITKINVIKLYYEPLVCRFCNILYKSVEKDVVIRSRPDCNRSYISD